MDCHLVKMAKAGQLADGGAIGQDITRIDSIFESDQFDVSIVKCKQCGQSYVYCFKEHTSPDGDDDCWEFWVPIPDNEIKDVKAVAPLLKFMGEMVHSRPHICCTPDDRVFWAQNGFPLAFIVFLP